MSSVDQKFLTGLMKIMARRGLKDAPLSEASGLGVTFIRDLKRSKSASPKLSSAVRIAEALGMTIDEVIAWADNSSDATPTVPVVGRVGAGARVPLVDAYAQGDGLYHVACPPQLSPRRLVAVEIEGQSMEPAYEAGDLLFYSRPTPGVPAEAIGQRCICEDAEGFAWVKHLRRRAGQPPGLFDLLSINVESPPIYDAVLIWAAPIRMHLQRAFAERVEPCADMHLTDDELNGEIEVS